MLSLYLCFHLHLFISQFQGLGEFFMPYKVLDIQNKKDKTVRVKNKLKLLSILYKGCINTVLCFILPIDKWHCQKGLK